MEERERVRDRPTLHEGIPWVEGNRKQRVLQGRKTSQHASLFFLKVLVQEGMLVTIGISLSVTAEEIRARQR